MSILIHMTAILVVSVILAVSRCKAIDRDQQRQELGEFLTRCPDVVFNTALENRLFRG